MLKRAAGIIALGILVLSMFSCANPRLIEWSSARGDEIKFLQTREAGCLSPGEIKIVKCKVAADGSLTNCEPVAVEYQE